jgi:predicted NodU family carbamoyl transferase
MIVLGVHDGHNASAALMIDGKVIANVSEERLNLPPIVGQKTGENKTISCVVFM